MIKNFLRTDFRSAIVVFLVALPLCLGIALASGAPLLSGIIAGVVGGLVVGYISGSHTSVSGPAAGLTSIALLSIAQLGSFEAFLCSVAIAGVIQILLGVFRAGFIAHFFPVSVIKGMLAAIGLILILKEFPHAVGWSPNYFGDEDFFQLDGSNTFTEIILAVNHITVSAVIISVISISILFFWNGRRIKNSRWLSVIPGALVVVILSVFLGWLFEWTHPDLAIRDHHLVSIPDFSSLPMLPDFSMLGQLATYKVAFTLAFVASIESLLSIEAADKIDPQRRITPPNRELIAQGAGNLTCGLLGGIPVSAVIVRSSANVQAGSRTKASAVAHGVLLLLAVALLPGFIEQIPLSALAAILLVVGYKLTPFSLFKEMYRSGWHIFAPFIVTVLAVLFSNLLMGVLAGLVVAVIAILNTNYHTTILMVSDKNKYLIRFTSNVTFLNKATLRNAFSSIEGGSQVVIDGSRAVFVDMDIRETIRDFLEYARAKNIAVQLIKIKI
ncbi:MAG: hypothetical protein CRN43_06905 [Candidatus Nephrothrix sp. EaCA]|nr:MAG: hypothetical protein CRN43_06905 [Candidatus Nephrothrix sp. EaCA]